MDISHFVETWARTIGRPAGADAVPIRTAPVSARAAVESQSRRRWNSRQLFGDQHEIEIAHAESVYRLRVTSLGKLILTK